MENSETRLHYLFKQYSSGSATAAEQAELRSLLVDHKESSEVQALLQNIWHDPSIHRSPMEEPDKKRILETIQTKISSRKARKNSFNRWSIAASIVFLLSVTGFYAYYSSHSGASPLVDASRHVPQSKKQRIILPDGSTVMLNEGSTLEYPATFNGSATREVTLHGEGYFDIQHNGKKPFIVYAGDLKTTVLGTAFNISAYDTSSNITVTVSRGKVQVDNMKQLLGILSEDQQISINKQKNTTLQKNIDSKKTIAWIDDIHFDDITFTEAATILQERFQVNVKFTNEHLKRCQFTASFLSDAELDNILSVICEFNNSTYTRSADGEIVIDGKGCM